VAGNAAVAAQDNIVGRDWPLGVPSAGGGTGLSAGCSDGKPVADRVFSVPTDESEAAGVWEGLCGVLLAGGESERGPK